ncbi:serine hydrolase domain-containing protein [Kordiimonas laminariae]|uniref:serine hydrolase domain-containing protein n=1 Tax=Kordiimonas laminariae TaxID=2917717 RepID=UPI001FF4C4ED|nr:serine hydrolase [Kordiimonas laminariae]MCK0070873.1 serine hydrolase [Kordiimonas laminariae]
MTINSHVKRILAVALLSSFSSFAVIADDQNRNSAEASPAEANLSFRDIPLLEKAFINTSPALRDDSFPVGKLTIDAEKKAALIQFAKELGESTYGNYDSLLITHKDKLVFESYFRRGRINLTHGQASATKGYTSLILGRAMQLGYLTMADLDKPLISFLKNVDRTKLTEGAEKITLHKALTMHGGLSINREEWTETEKTPEPLQGQGLVQSLLEHSAPITKDTQVYNYGNFNPMLVMSVIDAVVPGSAQEFIKTEVLDKLGIKNYQWKDHISGLPEAGWRVSMASRDMLKFGSIMLNDGKLNQEQFIPAQYLEKATSGLVKPTEDWIPDTYRYGYFFYQTPLTVEGKSYNATFAWGGGGQRIIVIDELDLTIVITGHDREDQIMAQIENIVVPAFIK